MHILCMMQFICTVHTYGPPRGLRGVTVSENDVLRMPLPSDGPLEAPAEWERLRRRRPVATVELPSGDRAALLTRYDHVRALLSDRRFVRPTAADDAARVAPEGSGGVAATGEGVAVPMAGDAHLRWRRMVGKWFTAKRMTAMRPAMAEIAGTLIDEMVDHRPPADLRAGLGFPLPVYVICDMLGVPAADRNRFSYWSDAFLSVTRYTAEETRDAHAALTAYMSAHIAAKRADPADDLLSMLIGEGGPDGRGLTDDALTGTGMGLLVAGHETTANMIGKMISLLLVDRTRWERLLADPSLVRTAVDEALRFDTNLGFGVRRYVSEDVELDGAAISAGTTVVCSMPAANRDETTFSGAGDLDLARSPNPHLTFGAGPHACLGQSLARTELQVTLETLLRKLPTLELAVPAADLKPVEGLLVGGLREVPVRW